MLSFIDIFAQTLRTLWAHKLRSFLTMFGIAWGVCSLLILVGVGEGFRSGNARQLATLGEDTMFIFSGEAPTFAGQRSGLRHYQLTYDDYLDVLTQTHYVRSVAPILGRSDIQAVSEFGNMAPALQGTTPSLRDIRYIPLDGGRWLNEADDEQHRHVAVIGTEVIKNLFPGKPAIGSLILLNGQRFTVIGTVGKIGQGQNRGENTRIFIPIQTMMETFPYVQFTDNRAIAFMNYRPRIRSEHELARQEVHRIIARNHGFDPNYKEAWNEWDTIKNSENVGKIFDQMNYFLGSVGLVTLALGAIGIINIMLVSVSERTPEIGLRKALGATHGNVLMQFFLEGACLTLLSGFFGLGVAASLMKGLSLLPQPPGFDTPHIVPMSAAVSIGSLALAGVIAGLYPARKAAMLPPVEALRRE